MWWANFNKNNRINTVYIRKKIRLDKSIKHTKNGHTKLKVSDYAFEEWKQTKLLPVKRGKN